MDIEKLISGYKKKAALHAGAANSWAGISNVKYQSFKDQEALCREFIAVLISIQEDNQEINNLALPTNSIASDSVKH